MRIAPLLRRTGFILLLLLIPILLGIRFKWDAILPAIICLQLLIIWGGTSNGDGANRSVEDMRTTLVSPFLPNVLMTELDNMVPRLIIDLC